MALAALYLCLALPANSGTADRQGLTEVSTGSATGYSERLIRQRARARLERLFRLAQDRRKGGGDAGDLKDLAPKLPAPKTFSPPNRQLTPKKSFPKPQPRKALPKPKKAAPPKRATPPPAKSAPVVKKPAPSPGDQQQDNAAFCAKNPNNPSCAKEAPPKQDTGPVQEDQAKLFCRENPDSPRCAGSKGGEEGAERPEVRDGREPGLCERNPQLPQCQPPRTGGETGPPPPPPSPGGGTPSTPNPPQGENECPAGQYALNGACVTECPPDASFNLNGQCVPVCPEGTYSDNITSNCMSTCPEGGVVVIGVHYDLCLAQCPDGQGRLGDITCGPCPSGTSVVDGICAQCPEGQTVENGVCVGGCPEGYAVIAGQCRLQSCPEGQVKHDGGCVDSCPEGMVKTQDGGCMGRAACYSQGGEVYNGPNGRECVDQCPEGSVKYVDGCYDQCPEGTVLSGDGVMCGTCSPGMVVENGQCVSQCPSGTVYSGGQCLEPCPGGNDHYADGSCPTQCPDGQWTGADGQCPPCAAGFELTEGQCTLSCPEGFDENGRCMACPEGKVNHQGTCRDYCAVQGYTLTINGVCVAVCPEGQRLYQGQCQELDSCPEGSIRGAGFNVSVCFEECPQGQAVVDTTAGPQCRYQCFPGTQTPEGDCSIPCNIGEVLGSDGQCSNPCPEGKISIAGVCRDPNAVHGCPEGYLLSTAGYCLEEDQCNVRMGNICIGDIRTYEDAVRLCMESGYLSADPPNQANCEAAVAESCESSVSSPHGSVDPRCIIPEDYAPAPPGEDQQPPAEDQQPPAEDQQPPAEDQQPPPEDQQPPAEDQQPPAEDQQPPPEDQQPPQEDQAPEVNCPDGFVPYTVTNDGVTTTSCRSESGGPVDLPPAPDESPAPDAQPDVTCPEGFVPYTITNDGVTSTACRSAPGGGVTLPPGQEPPPEGERVTCPDGFVPYIVRRDGGTSISCRSAPGGKVDLKPERDRHPPRTGVETPVKPDTPPRATAPETDTGKKGAGDKAGRQPAPLVIVLSTATHSAGGIPANRHARAGADEFMNYLLNDRKLARSRIIRLSDMTRDDFITFFGQEDEVDSQLGKALKNANASEVILYAAGHGLAVDGGDDAVLLPTDADPARPEETGYRLSWLYGNLASLEVEKLQVYLDASFSPQIGARPGPDAAEAKPVVSYPVIGLFGLFTPSSWVVITAASGDGPALSDPSQPISAFSYGVIAGLRGLADSAEDGNNDLSVSAGELLSWLRGLITPAVKQGTGGDQEPELHGSGDEILTVYDASSP